MASLENKKIKDTYEGLLKTDDNAAIDGAVEITDGAGNGTGVTISNDGQVTATGTVSFGSLKDTGEDITVTKFVDEADGIGNNDNDTSVPTSAAVKDYVDTNVTAQDLDFQGDSGSGAVDLDSQSLDIAGGTGIDTSAVDQTLTVNIDSTVATLSDTQTLTNKSIDLTDNTLSGTTSEFNTALSDDDFATLTGTETLTNKTVDADNNTVSNLEVDNLKSGVLDTDLTSVSASDDTLASAKAIKTYVDSNITAQDLDITDGTTTSAVDLDSQTLTIEGTANEVEVSLTDQSFTVGLPTSITTNVTGNLTGNVTGNVTGDLTGNVTGNVTGDVTGNADTASALETARTISLSGDVSGSVSFDGSANADITATIQANSVALGTDTTGDYVENLGTGTGVTIGSNSGEGSSPTISVDYGSTANTAVQGDTSLTIQGTANEIEVTGGGVTLGSGGTVTVGLPNDVSLGGSLTIAQNLTVNGTTTTVNTDTLSVEDPLIELARDNSENSVDVGLYGKYSLDSGTTTKYSGLFKDASDSDKFKLFKGLEVEPTSTVDTAGTGYAKGDLVINDLDAVTISGNLTGNVTGDLTGDSSGTHTGGVVGNVTGNVTGDLTGDVTGDLTGSVLTAAQTNITSVGTLSSLTVSGDLTVDTNTLYVDSSNNRIGIGTSSPDSTLTLNGSSSSRINLRTSDTRYGTIFSDSGLLAIASITSIPIVFAINDVEKMRLDSSGNLGLGTSSPAGKLAIKDGNVYIDRDTTSGNYAFGFYRSGAERGRLGFDYSSSTLNLQADGVMTFLTSGENERMRIDSSGNVQIGSGTRYGKFDILDIGGSGTNFIVGTGSNGDNYFTSGTSGVQVFRGGSTERMRIDSSGNVGIGTSSPDVKTHIFGGSDSQENVLLKVQSNGVANDSSLSTSILLANSTALSSTHGVKISSIRTGSTTEDFAFYTYNSGMNERMRIDSSGNVGIGTSSPDTKLTIEGDSPIINIRNTAESESGINFVDTASAAQSARIMYDSGSSNALIFYNNAITERMRITSGGDVLIGCTSSPSDTVFGAGIQVHPSGGRYIETSINSTSTVTHMQFVNPNGNVGTIQTSGSSTSYNTSSDYRLKENVADMTGALDRVDQLKPSRFNFIADEDTTVDGFLAHQVQDIVPEAVTGEKDAVDEDGNDVYQGIDQSKLVPLLVGAIKELRAEVNSLKAQINN